MTSLRPSLFAPRTITFSNPWGVLPLLAGVAMLGVLSMVAPAVAAEAPSTPDVSAAALEQLRAANVARAELAKVESEWRSERDRLQAAIAATRAEVARLERDAADAEGQRDSARSKLAAIGDTSDLDVLRQRLGETGVALRAALTALARTVPPGTIAVPAQDLVGEGAFDAAVRALDAAERAAGTLAVEVVTGTRGGRAEAVKLLRVAGAVAWWVSLDGTAAGLARMADGALHLDAATDELTRIAITAALAQAEGRAQPTVLVLPAPTVPAPTVPATTTGGTP